MPVYGSPALVRLAGDNICTPRQLELLTCYITVLFTLNITAVAHATYVRVRIKVRTHRALAYICDVNTHISAMLTHAYICIVNTRLYLQC